MPRARTSVSDVSTVLAQQLRAELRDAAGGNTLLSRTEQRTAMPHIKDAADELRDAGGPGARVTVDALEANLHAKAMRLIDTVNQTSGPGAHTLSRKEAHTARDISPHVGEAVLRAYQVASGNAADVDAIAASRVNQSLPADTVFKTFASEAEATSYQDPDGKQVWWLVAERDTVRTKSFVAGRNDLWAERFDIDRLSGVVTVTAEH
jgi:hypothetical protein